MDTLKEFASMWACAAADLLQLLELRAGALLHEHVELLAQPLLGALLQLQRLVSGLEHLRTSWVITCP